MKCFKKADWSSNLTTLCVCVWTGVKWVWDNGKRMFSRLFSSDNLSEENRRCCAQVSAVLSCHAWQTGLRQVEPGHPGDTGSTKWSVWAYLHLNHWHSIPKVAAVSRGWKNVLCRFTLTSLSSHQHQMITLKKADTDTPIDTYDIRVTELNWLEKALWDKMAKLLYWGGAIRLVILFNFLNPCPIFSVKNKSKFNWWYWEKLHYAKASHTWLL